MDAITASSKRNEKPKRPKSTVKKCYRCGEDHEPKTCTNLRVCYRCRGTDHLSVDCPKKPKKKVSTVVEEV